eukprot:3894932-Lingulodinium_polyedra.AAC.1
MRARASALQFSNAPRRGHALPQFQIARALRNCSSEAHLHLADARRKTNVVRLRVCTASARFETAISNR